MPLFRFNMYTVYVLYSERFDKIYIGYTSDLPARLRYHNELARKGWAIHFRPWKIVYIEEFETKSGALKREKELKSHQGRNFISRLVI